MVKRTDKKWKVSLRFIILWLPELLRKFWLYLSVLALLYFALIRSLFLKAAAVQGMQWLTHHEICMGLLLQIIFFIISYFHWMMKYKFEWTVLCRVYAISLPVSGRNDITKTSFYKLQLYNQTERCLLIICPSQSKNSNFFRVSSLQNLNSFSLIMQFIT